jgi:hypothetical protein
MRGAYRLSLGENQLLSHGLGSGENPLFRCFNQRGVIERFALRDISLVELMRCAHTARSFELHRGISWFLDFQALPDVVMRRQCCVFYTLTAFTEYYIFQV